MSSKCFSYVAESDTRLDVLPVWFGILGAVEADLSGLVVVFAHDAGVVVLGHVRGRVDAEGRLADRAAISYCPMAVPRLAWRFVPNPSVV